jgi:photosystem II stability/assembly factor-like uncharacterized protein
LKDSKVNFKYLILMISAAIACLSATEDFSWKNVEIGSGGFDCGILYHPLKQGLMFCRSDVCGAHKWDNANSRWIDLLSHHYDYSITDGPGGRGGIGLAIDPTDTNIVYASRFGLERTTDDGRSWQMLIDKYCGNNMREHGEPIGVDPLNTSVIYYATANEGLWFSIDKGAHWSQVPTAQIPAWPDPGITIIAIDPSVSLNGRSRRIYVNAYAKGFYWSDDAGATFSLLSTAPKNIARIAFDKNGIAYIAANNDGLVRFDPAQRTITTITPSALAGGRATAVAVRKGTEDVLVAIDKGHRIMARCTKPVSPSGWTTIDYVSMENVQPWFKMKYWSWLTASDLAFDPFHRNSAVFGDCFAYWRTDDVWTKGTSASSPVVWTSIPWGNENTVISDLACPAPGSTVQLYSGLRDIVGFSHTDVSVCPLKCLEPAGSDDIMGVAVYEKNPRVAAFISPEKITGDGMNVFISTDDGVTLRKLSKPFASGATSYPARIAISSADSANMVAITYQNPPRYTTDCGATWNNCGGVEQGSLFKWGSRDEYTFPLDNDKVTPGVFYLVYNGNGHVLRSTDGGATFLLVNSSLPKYSGNIRVGSIVRAVPTRASEVWVSLGGGGLYRSINGGTTFTKVSGFDQTRLISFGKAAPGSSIPTAYVQGIRSGVLGVYRSLDDGQNWEIITDPMDPKMGETSCMAASRDTYGRVFIGTRGLGIFYSSKEDATRTHGMLPALQSMKKSQIQSEDNGLYDLRGRKVLRRGIGTQNRLLYEYTGAVFWDSWIVKILE